VRLGGALLSRFAERRATSAERALRFGAGAPTRPRPDPGWARHGRRRPPGSHTSVVSSGRRRATLLREAGVLDRDRAGSDRRRPGRRAPPPRCSPPAAGPRERSGRRACSRVLPDDDDGVRGAPLGRRAPRGRSGRRTHLDSSCVRRAAGRPPPARVERRAVRRRRGGRAGSVFRELDLAWATTPVKLAGDGWGAGRSPRELVEQACSSRGFWASRDIASGPATETLQSSGLGERPGPNAPPSCGGRSRIGLPPRDSFTSVTGGRRGADGRRARPPAPRLRAARAWRVATGAPPARAREQHAGPVQGAQPASGGEPDPRSPPRTRRRSLARAHSHRTRGGPSTRLRVPAGRARARSDPRRPPSASRD
jgi:hypothetical protein